MRERSAARGAGVLGASYGAFGFFWGCWVVVFADFLDAHSLTPGQGSVKFVALSVTAIIAMTLLAPRLEAIERGRIVAASLLVHAAGALAIAFAPSGWLVAAFGLTGVGTGLIDVYVNSAGQAIESRSSSSVLQPVHAAYGVGGALGAVMSGVALTVGISYVGVLVVAAVVQAVAGLVSARSTHLRFAPPPDEAGAAISLSAFRRWPYLLAPAIVVMAAFFIEGSMDVWSVIYLRRTLGASELAGSWGFAAFALSVAAGRLFAARILFGMGYRRTIFWSGLGAGLAGAIAVSTSSPGVASFAFLLLGFSLSAAAPAALGIAGETGAGASLAVAAITTVGYTGFVVGPPALGWLADQSGLRATMAALMLATVVIIVGSLFGRRGSSDTSAIPSVRRS